MAKSTALTPTYKLLKRKDRDRPDRSYATLLLEACSVGRSVLRTETRIVELSSRVAGKTYFAFQRVEVASNKETTRTSRPINKALYVLNDIDFGDLRNSFLEGDYNSIGALQATRLLYTLAMDFCAANDVLATGDKKTPATFFELFISHLIARRLGVLPTNKVRVPAAEDVMVDLPTDLIFDTGSQRPKFHVPVKLSTRERVIQAWAHQKVIEGLWGTTAFRGILAILSETKLDLAKLEVTEICLPNQWRIYQRYIARISRAYYLDVPVQYADLSKGNPRIDVKPLGEFFSEIDSLLEW